MRRLITLMAIACLSTSCLKLDSLLYSPYTDIESYALDDYEGRQEIEVGAEYAIPESKQHLFTLSSDPEGDAKEIWALYIGDISRIATDTVILYLHGNTGHLDLYWTRIKLLANAGGSNRFGVMAIDYRGFGLSEGPPTEEGLYEDADAAMKWLKENGLSDDRLVVYGYSLGSAPATEITANPRTMRPSKLMLEAPFASDEVMVQDGSGLTMPGDYFSSLQIDNADEIKKVNVPFFWIHGTADSFLSIETHGEVVYKNYEGIYSEAHRVEGGEHSDVPAVMGLAPYLDVVLEFIER
ncbi:MAG: alpha/beta hydrolase [Cryomorphaceae bacterium]